MAGSTGVDCSSVVCPEGQSGPNCEYRACPRDCSGYGVCFNGECACDDDHMAPDCSIPRKCYDACHSVCMPDLTGSRCEFCKGQCLTLAMNPVVGNHNPMLARLYSFPQITSNATAARSPRHATSSPKSKKSKTLHRHLR